jgi:hypothetical protein
MHGIRRGLAVHQDSVTRTVGTLLHANNLHAHATLPHTQLTAQTSAPQNVHAVLADIDSLTRAF